VSDRVDYVGGTSSRPPDSLRATLYERDQNWTLAAARAAWRQDAPLDTLLTAPTSFTTVPIDPELPTAPPEFTEVTSGVWLASMEDLDTRSLVVEFTDHLAVVEFAIGSPNGERLVDGIKTRWPDKPIKWALFSHHHPHYLGGVRALVAEGATVVTTPGNEALVRKMCAAPFTLRPDRLARAPRPLQLQTFTGRFELKDASNQLVAIDIGARSTHTDEFVIFWLPKGYTLFETEQGWFGRDGVQRAGRRAANLLKILADENLPAQRIVQSWPMRGTAPQMLRTAFEKLVDERAAASRRCGGRIEPPPVPEAVKRRRQALQRLLTNRSRAPGAGSEEARPNFQSISMKWLVNRPSTRVEQRVSTRARIDSPSAGSRGGRGCRAAPCRL
jgi:hypothetical protein